MLFLINIKIKNKFELLLMKPTLTQTMNTPRAPSANDWTIEVFVLIRQLQTDSETDNIRYIN